jgi:hypothetical protein
MPGVRLATPARRTSPTAHREDRSRSASGKNYSRDFDASIEGGVGEATVLLPSEVGTRVRAEGGLGKINAKGLKREGDSYVNDACGDSDITLKVNVQRGVGQINLEVVGGLFVAVFTQRSGETVSQTKGRSPSRWWRGEASSGR